MTTSFLDSQHARNEPSCWPGLGWPHIPTVGPPCPAAAVIRGEWGGSRQAAVPADQIDPACLLASSEQPVSSLSHCRLDLLEMRLSPSVSD